MTTPKGLVEDPEFVIRLTGNFGRPLGRLATYESATFKPGWLKPGTFIITTSFRAPGAELFNLMPRVETILPGGRKFWGIIDEHWLTWDPDKGVMITVSGREVKTILERWRCWPNSTQPLNLQPANLNESYSNFSREDLAILLVRRNTDPNYVTDPARGMARLSTPALRGRGEVVPVYSSERWSNLLDNVIALLGPEGYGMSLVLDSTYEVVKFDTMLGVDRSASITFSPSRSSLVSLKVGQKPPKVNTIYQRGPYVNDYDSGVYTKYTRPQDSSWGGVFEEYQDASSDDPNNTADARATQANIALDEGSRSNLAQFEVQDTDVTQFGRDYDLGDKVSFYFDPVSFTDVITSVELTNDASSFRVVPTVGDGDDTTKSGVRTAKSIQALGRKVAALERN